MENQVEREENTSTIEIPHSKRKWFFLVLGIFVVIAGILFYIVRPPNAFSKSGGIVSITSGESLQDVGTDLEKMGFIRSPSLFGKLVVLFGGEHTLSPGDYYFSHRMSVVAVALQIASKNHNIEPIKITFPEGQTVSEIGALLSIKLPDFPEDDFLAVAKSDEGYLFPETYFFYPRTKPEEVLTQMRAMFDKQTADLFGTSTKETKEEREAIIMASIVEREAHGADDRTTIANILWKRLALGMPLQVDATVAYANGIAESALKKSDFAIDSPYNTYVHAGLPPGPIANPGLSAIVAALDKGVTPYLYYLHDKKGLIHYAKTYAEHQKNVARYLR